jgi:cupin 2 domain-containing protein
MVEELIRTDGVRVERIVSHGHASPPGFWYDQKEREWVMLLSGCARLRFEDDTVELNPGDWVNIPAHARHRVEWTKPGVDSVWLAIFY